MLRTYSIIGFGEIIRDELFGRVGDAGYGNSIWDADKGVTLGAEIIRDNVGYTPYEGRTVKGWPVTVIRCSRPVVDER